MCFGMPVKRLISSTLNSRVSMNWASLWLTPSGVNFMSWSSTATAKASSVA